MKISLTTTQIKELEAQHKKERDGRVRDRIKAVLLGTKGWSQVQIAEALIIRPETVHEHLQDFIQNQKLKPENGGSQSLLDALQTQAIIQHLEEYSYTKASDICAYVHDVYGVQFTISGMTKWLHHQAFSYKKPKGVPSKADPVKQAEFIAQYQDLRKTLPENEPIEFADGVHPTMATKISYGWIRKGKSKLIETTASRTRMNLFGSISLQTMQVTIDSYDTLNSQVLGEHFKKLRIKYPNASKIHLILDRGSYNTSKETAVFAEQYGIIIHHLPAYSPNLNPIERLWKIMNEYVRNNRYFKSAKDFREAVMNFFENTWTEIESAMNTRINDNFQTLK